MGISTKKKAMVVAVVVGSLATGLGNSAEAADKEIGITGTKEVQTVDLHIGDGAGTAKKDGADHAIGEAYLIGNEYIRYDNLTKNGTLTNKVKYNTEYGIAEQISPEVYFQIQGRNETKFQAGTVTHLNTWGKSFLRVDKGKTKV